MPLSPRLKLAFRVIYWIALVCVAAWLFRLDYRPWPAHAVTGLLIAAWLMFVLGNLLDVLATQALAPNRLPLRDVFVLVGKSSFAKYIPAKLGIIATRGMLFSVDGSIRSSAMGVIRLQVTYLVTGVLAGLPFFGNIWLLIPLAAAIACWRLPQQWRHAVWFSLIMWAAWNIGFWLVLQGCHETMAGIAHASLFSLASVAGIVAIFSPGGLGVREGAMAIGLKMLGMPGAPILGIALATRLMFFAAECTVFCSALLVERLSRAETPSGIN